MRLLPFKGKVMLEEAMAHMMTGYLETLPDTGRMVEIGTGWGESALFFALTKPGWTIYTIDGFGMVGDGRIWKEFQSGNILKARSQYGSAPNIIQILGDSQAMPWELPVDCIYLDGDHRYEGCKRDFDIYSPHLKPGGIIFFDDFYQPNNPTNGVQRVVEELCAEDGEWELLFADITAAVKKKHIQLF